MKEKNERKSRKFAFPWLHILVINIAIWSKKNGQDDLRWFSVPYSESIKIDFSAFNDSGIYLIDVYRIKNGKSYYSTGTTLFID